MFSLKKLYLKIKLKNPEDVRTITLNGKRVKTDASKSINLALKTVSFSNQAQNRLEFSYSSKYLKKIKVKYLTI